jgi:FAD/FMN-containing dehydrogenase
MAVQPSAPRLDDAQLRAFAEGLTGSILTPSDTGYEEARQVNDASVDRRPAVMVLAAGVEDVVQAVRLARESGLELAVRCGGHSIAGHSATEGGILLDLAGLGQIEIDADARVGSAGGGVRAGAFVEAAFAHGLTVPFGDSADVGLGGLTLGGGVGWLARNRGLTIDHLQEVELVTADGEVVVASETSNPDLFWGLRGGGGNFGVATRFTYRLSPIGMVLGGAIAFPLTVEALRAVVDAAAAAPEELTAIIAVMQMPPLPFVPEQHHFQPSILAMVVYDGDPESGQAVVAPLRTAATPIVDMIGPMPYPAIYQLTEEGSQRAPITVQSVFLDELSDAAIAEIVARGATAPSPMAMTQVRVLGGAVARVPADATAYAFRDRRILVANLTMYMDLADQEAAEAWTREFTDALRDGSRGMYSNFIADEGREGVHAAYPGETYERLAALKRRYDPENLFRRNHNIEP